MKKGCSLMGLLALIAVTVVGCGGGGSSTTGGGGSSTTGTEAASAPEGGIAPKTAKLYAEYTKGTPGAADEGKPAITIGFMNNEGGVPSFPEGTAAGEAAVEFVNQELGGVDGSPVKLATCFVAGSEEQGQSCGQQFLSEELPIVVEANGSVGGQALHQTINGKIPVIISNPNSIADATAKNGYGLSAGIFGTGPADVAYGQLIGAKTASLLYPGDDPTGQRAAKQIQGEFEKAGIKVTSSGFNSSAPELLPNVIASGAGKTDLTVGLFVTPSACVSGAKALERGNVQTPILGLFLCLSGEVKKELGDFAKWTYVSESTNPSVSGEPMTDGYLEVMKSYAPDELNTGGNAQTGFSSVLTAVRALNEAGGPKATAATAGKAIQGLTGPIPMFAPEVKFGSVPGLPTLPNLASRFYEYKGEGQWKEVNGGEWSNPVP